MTTATIWETRFAPSAKVVAREIEGEMIIVPLTGDLGDLTDDLFTLNATGKAIWQACDGQTTLRQIVDQFSENYPVPREVIEREVVGFVEELCGRGIFIEQ